MKDTKYIFRKIIIGVGIALCLMFIKSCNVNAIATDFNVYINNTLMTSSVKKYSAGAENINVSIRPTSSAHINYEMPQYGYMAICSAFGSYADRYINTVSSNQVGELSVINSTVGCTIPTTSAYRATARVIYITFKIPYTYYDCGAGGVCQWKGNVNFAWYQPASNEFSLISYGFNNEPYNFNDTTDPSVIQNDTIINQNDTIINNQNQINSNLTDETSPNLNGLENSAGWLKPGPVDSILNLPLTLLNNLQTNLGNTCNPVVVNLPYVDKDISLPCISAIYKQIDGLDVWFQGIGVIAAAFILYKYFMYLYNRIDDTLSFRENNMQGYFDDSLWGGM